jgi:hypothetical protein
MILDLVGEVGDQLGSLCQVAPPARMATERFWNAWEPGQRTWVDRCERWEAPVEDGGHVAGSAEVSSAGGRQHVAEWVLSSFGREGEQVGLTQSVAVRRSRRSLARVMITSPTLAWLPSAKHTSRPAG